MDPGARWWHESADINFESGECDVHLAVVWWHVLVDKHLVQDREARCWYASGWIGTNPADLEAVGYHGYVYECDVRRVALWWHVWVGTNPDCTKLCSEFYRRKQERKLSSRKDPG